MGQETEPEDVEPIEGEGQGALAAVVGAIGTYLGDIPIVLKKNIGKAFGQLMKIPGAWIDGKAAEIKAVSDARVAITKATGKSISKQLNVDASVAAIAADTHASKILRQTINTAKVLQQAAEDIGRQAAPTEQAIPDISDDWLNAFEQEAVNMSSEHMQKLFGKILAGEIRRPKSYSIRTIKLMAQLDNRPAELFQKFCSLTCTMALGSHVADSRVVGLGTPAAANGLSQFGLDFGALNILFEYGLIISDYNSYMMYGPAIADGRTVQMPLRYMNRHIGLAPRTPMTAEQRMLFKVNGVQLSRAGMELLGIVELEENVAYTKALIEYFNSQGYDVQPVTVQTA
jgi:hypothetical protein